MVLLLSLSGGSLLPDGSQLKVPGVVPKLSATPGRVDGGGPALGQHTDEALAAIGVDSAELSRLRRDKVI